MGTLNRPRGDDGLLIQPLKFFIIKCVGNVWRGEGIVYPTLYLLYVGDF